MNAFPHALFISHGGGPMPLLGDPGHRQMVSCLQGIAASIPRPDAILVISAHWEEQRPAITSGSNPTLIYDYYGFPPESYEIQYPCPGDPALAREVHRLLGNSGIETTLDETRGFDHGVFVSATMPSKCGCRTPAVIAHSPSRPDGNNCSTGAKRQEPAFVIHAKNICCHCMFAMAPRKLLARSSTKLSS